MAAKNDGRFIGSDLWKQIVETTDSVAFAARQEAAKILTEGDLRDLVQRLDSDSSKEQSGALGMLVLAVRDNNDHAGVLLAELREKAAQLAKAWTIEKPPFDIAEIERWGLAVLTHHRPADVARQAYALLAAIDREVAGQFLVSHFPYESLSAQGRERVIRHFAELCNGEKSKRSETAMRRLIEIARQGEPEARKAAGYLIGGRLMTRSEVEKITERWRATPPDTLPPSAVPAYIAQHPRFAGREAELAKVANDWLKTRSIRALNHLYSHFLLGLREGFSSEPLLAILGTPDWWVDSHPHTYVFSSDEGPGLLLEVTTEGLVCGFNLK